MENFEIKGLLKVSEKPNELHIYSTTDGKKICTLKPDNNIKPFFSENLEDVRKKFNELDYSFENPYDSKGWYAMLNKLKNANPRR